MENEYIPQDDKFLKKRENGMLLSDYQIDVLQRNGIDYKNFGSINQILMEINDILDEDDSDLEELDEVAREIAERVYYESKKN